MSKVTYTFPVSVGRNIFYGKHQKVDLKSGSMCLRDEEQSQEPRKYCIIDRNVDLRIAGYEAGQIGDIFRINGLRGSACMQPPLSQGGGKEGRNKTQNKEREGGYEKKELKKIKLVPKNTKQAGKHKAGSKNKHESGGQHLKIISTDGRMNSKLLQNRSNT